MQQSDLVSKILSNTFKKNECYKKLLLLEDFISHEYSQKQGDVGTLTDQFKARYAGTSDETMRDSVGEWGDEFFNTILLSGVEAIEGLRHAVTLLPEIVLYVPTVFDGGQVKRIGEWCRTHMDATVCLDLRIDESTVGGCIVVWKNVLYDFSLEYFTRQHRDEISQMIARVLSVDPQSKASA